MQLAIGLPNAVPGVGRGEMLEWARRAEARGFSGLGTIDRLVYPNWEPLVALAAAAAVTERIRLMTTVMLAPLRETTLMAKQCATLDQLSGGRLVVGLGAGAREDDFDVAGARLEGRGRRLERQLDEMRRLWGGEKVGLAGGVGPTPALPEGPIVLVGGGVDASFRRAARMGHGWIMGGGPPDQFAEMAAKVRDAWREAGRDGEPALAALGYFCLGDGAGEQARRYALDYYEWLGEEVAGMIGDSTATDAGTVRGYLDAFAEAGCEELVLFPCSSDPAQVDMLADAAELAG